MAIKNLVAAEKTEQRCQIKLTFTLNFRMVFAKVEKKMQTGIAKSVVKCSQTAETSKNYNVIHICGLTLA